MVQSCSRSIPMSHLWNNSFDFLATENTEITPFCCHFSLAVTRNGVNWNVNSRAGRPMSCNDSLRQFKSLKHSLQMSQGVAFMHISNIGFSIGPNPLYKLVNSISNHQSDISQPNAATPLVKWVTLQTPLYLLATSPWAAKTGSEWSAEMQTPKVSHSEGVKWSSKDPWISLSARSKCKWKSLADVKNHCSCEVNRAAVVFASWASIPHRTTSIQTLNFHCSYATNFQKIRNSSDLWFRNLCENI